MAGLTRRTRTDALISSQDISSHAGERAPTAIPPEPADPPPPVPELLIYLNINFNNYNKINITYEYSHRKRGRRRAAPGERREAPVRRTPGPENTAPDMCLMMDLDVSMCSNGGTTNEQPHGPVQGRGSVSLAASSVATPGGPDSRRYQEPFPW